MTTQVAELDNLRSLAFGSISGTYAAVGTPFTSAVRLVCFTNNTDGDMLFSNDGVNDKLFIPKGSFKLFDVSSNRNNNNVNYVFRTGTQFYVKQSTAPTTGSVYIEALLGN